MRHLTPVSRRKPAPAQFEPLLQLVALISSALSLLTQLSDIFGFSLPTKGDEV